MTDFISEILRHVFFITTPVAAFHFLILFPFFLLQSSLSVVFSSLKANTE